MSKLLRKTLGVISGKKRHSHYESPEVPAEQNEPETLEDEENDKVRTPPISLAIIGVGQRGKAFAHFAKSRPHQCVVVAIAEPRPETRLEFLTLHNISEKNAFASHSELLDYSDAIVRDGKPRLAQAVVICVQDKLHAQLSIEFSRRGFHVLCEKPLGVTIEECIQVARVVEKSNIVFALGHNFPYSPYATSLSELIHGGSLGRLLNVTHLEPVGYYHFAHSYVRGHWQSEKTSAPIVLTKSSHDLDIFSRWLWPLVPNKVASFGSLSHFRKERKPLEALGVTRCLECPASVEERCEYSAKRIYLSPVLSGMSGWPGNLIVDGRPSVEKMMTALQETPYGLCVYESNNDVPDHQTISIQLSAPIDEVPGDPHLPPTNPTISFTIAAHTDSICMRKTTFHFEHGEVIGDMSTYTVSDFREPGKGARRVIPPSPMGGGHGGGDWGLMDAWIRAINQKVNGEEVTALGVGAGIRDQLRVFLTGFAIEEARREMKVVDCREFEERMLAQFSREAIPEATLAIEYEL